MATPADVAAFRTSQSDLVALALADLLEWWQQSSRASVDALTAALTAFLPELVAVHGETAALAAADWFDDLRLQADPPGRFRAVMADPVPPEQAAAVARWAVGPLYSPTPDRPQTLRNLSGAVQRLVLEPARETIADSVRRDPADARWARVPGRSDPCAFCRMLASRGAVYHSEAAAGGMHRYHGKCGCVPTPVWPGEQEPYDVAALAREYREARAKAGGNPKALLAQLRVDQDAR
ncbi:hypothetical protein [Micromonospora sp. NPDC005652]|uniref:VG15 protein n=1 Tax=Micromonospora sp. NPDC005652 TaxID=3157046 RepID=UPI0034015620